MAINTREGAEVEDAEFGGGVVGSEFESSDEDSGEGDDSSLTPAISA